MRKQTLSLALAGILSLAAVPAQAFFEANVAAGYTTLAMGDLNDALGAGATQIKSGYYISADAGIAMLPFLKLDPRVVYVQASQGAVGKTTIDANIVPLELGLAADISVPLSGLSARVGAWGGYGFATASMASNYGVPVTALYQGGAFTAEILGAFRYKVAPFVALSIEAGYRMANVPEMQDAAGQKLTKISSTNSLPLDFSGANVGGGLTFSF